MTMSIAVFGKRHWVYSGLSDVGTGLIGRRQADGELV